MMKVSIITATYNSAGTIGDTLRSVGSQTHDEIEHIIVDGASQDETLMIVRAHAFDARIISEPDNGIYDAMNKGIRMATGDIVGILNSDDMYSDSSIIARVAREMEVQKSDALYGDLVYVDARDTSRVVRTWTAGAFRPEKFLNGWMPPHPTFFVRRSVYERYGCFDTALRSSADYELMLRFLFRFRIPVTYLPHRLVYMRTGGQSNASLSNRLRANQEDSLAWKKNGLIPRFYTMWLKPIRKIPQFLT